MEVSVKKKRISLAQVISLTSTLVIRPASEDSKQKQHDVFCLFASMDCPDTVYCGFQCLLDVIRDNEEEDVADGLIITDEAAEAQGICSSSLM
ncbi:hypothetical protein YC2023_046113 [Brassica napus]